MIKLKEQIALSIFNAYLTRNEVCEYGSYKDLWNDCLDDANYAMDEKNDQNPLSKATDEELSAEVKRRLKEYEKKFTDYRKEYEKRGLI